MSKRKRFTPPKLEYDLEMHLDCDFRSAMRKAKKLSREIGASKPQALPEHKQKYSMNTDAAPADFPDKNMFANVRTLFRLFWALFDRCVCPCVCLLGPLGFVCL